MKPDVGQRREYDREVSSASSSARAGKKSGNVLKQEPSSWPNKLIGEPGELEEQAGSLTVDESGSATGDAEVLTGGAAGEQINASPASPPFGSVATVSADSDSDQLSTSSIELRTCERTNVLEAGHSGPVTGEHPSAVLIGLALGDDPPSRSLEPEVDASDPGAG